MATRFSFYASNEKMKRQFNLNIKNNLQASYNIGAGQNAYVLTNQSSEIQIFRWGLIPHWAKEESTNLIQATAEGIASKLSFRMPIRQKRCIVFADSYYEWKKDGREKRPYRVLLNNNELLAFAGVWDIWESPNKKFIKTFSLITVRANDVIYDLGVQRMPVILDTKEKQETWLAESSLDTVRQLLQPIDNEILQTYPISKEVDDITNNYPDLHKAIL